MPFLGLRDSTDFVNNERPESWREMILYLYPNGRAPLTALTSMASVETVNDPHFHWFLKSFPTQSGDVTGVFENAALSSAHTTAGSKGDTLYLDVSQALAEEFRAGFTALVTQKGDYRHNTPVEVVATGDATGDYYLQVVLKEDEDASNPIFNGTADLWVEQTGSAHEEGATMPSAISYDVTEGDNYTQIFRTPLKITRTAKQTRYRTGDKKEELKAEALDLHAVEMEKALLWGTKDIDTSGSEPKRFTQGIVNAILNDGPAQNVDSFVNNANYTGKTWLQGGQDWLNNRLEILFREGDPEKLALCGSKALLGINRLAESLGDFAINSETTAFGMSIKRWVTPFGDIMLKTHPLMNRSPAWRNDMVLIEPRRLRLRTVQDTMYKEDNSENTNTNDSRDSDEEEFLTEMGLEYGHLGTMGYLANVGEDA